MTTTVETQPATTTIPLGRDQGPVDEIELPVERGGITVEHIMYLVIFLCSLAMHLWALDARALHHDESHHSYYPWRLYTKTEYVHDPLLHGPFLYFINALFFMVFSDTNFTTRLSAALFGTVLTVLPWMLRREMGRTAALLASGYLLVSPVALYVGRFIRHDIYSLVFELLCVIGIVRYIATKERRYLYLFSASFGFMVTNMESSYLFLAIIGSFMLIAALWHLNWRYVVALVVFVVAGFFVGALSPPVLASDGTTPMPLVTDNDALLIRNQSDNNWGDYFRKLGEVLFGHETSTTEGVSGYNGVFLHLWVPIIMGMAVVFFGALIVLIFRRKDEDGRSVWRRAVDAAPANSLLPALDTLRGRRVAIAFGIYFTIYALLFSSFLFNSVGILTGTTGSLLYWVGQHDVNRGGQPQLYYLVQLIVYEPLLLLWGFAGAIAGGLQGLVRLWRREAFTARTIVPPLLGWWSLGAFGFYSWAGEKMPWLTSHVVLPLTLSAAWFTWAALKRLLALGQPESRRAMRVVFVGLLTIGVFFVLRMTHITSDVNAEAYQLSTSTVGLFLVIVLAMLGAYAAWQSANDSRPLGVALSRAGGVGLLALSLLLLAYTLRSSWRLNYQTGDVPVESLVYVQSSPNVARVMAQLEQVSTRESRGNGQTGERSLRILYDNETIWKWYFRNYPNAQDIGPTLSAPPEANVAAVFFHGENIGANEKHLGEFVAVRLPMRWWLPEEETYRTSDLTPEQGLFTRFDDLSCPTRSLADRVLCTPFKAEVINEFWNYMMYRKLPGNGTLGSVDFTLYVRPEYADAFLLSPKNLSSAQ